ncbi:MAG: 30S ribosomal protein S24e [Thermoplasmata archaeon]|nr:MAG: 30S ribosomal protein S24e [Thermoplasmata archaeon]RLF53996.1 MAG: 30S ribosomal protein S24e [Thermoplasmata archaeon]
MEIEIESRRENKLLEREEIRCIAVYEGTTPTRKKVKETLKNSLGVGGYIVIQEIRPFFGTQRARIYAKVYPSEEVARKVERAYVLKRAQSGKKEEKKEKAPEAEEKKEEKKEKAPEAEEKKEEKTEEGGEQE